MVAKIWRTPARSIVSVNFEQLLTVFALSFLIIAIYLLAFHAIILIFAHHMKEFGFIHMAVRPDEQIGLHEHPEWEISYVVRGSGMRTMGTVCEPFGPGEVVMVQPDMPHCWAFDSSYSEIECMSLFFSNSLLERISGLSDGMAEVVRLATGTTDTVAFGGRALATLSALMAQMAQMADAQRMVAFQQMLLAIASNDGKRSVGRMADDVEQRLGRIRVYINCN